MPRKRVPSTRPNTKQQLIRNRRLYTPQEIFTGYTPVPATMPMQVARAGVAFERAYAPIRPKVEANRRKYRGTKYEDCPPTLGVQFQFFVRAQDIGAAHEYLFGRYGCCSFRWAYVVA
jgi:hypothetical protein